jgi:hypothetical protein
MRSAYSRRASLTGSRSFRASKCAATQRIMVFVT